MSKIFVIIGTVGVLGAIAWGSLALVNNESPADDRTLPAATGRPLWRPTPSGSPDATTPAATTRPVVLFDGPLTIAGGLGIDVDQADERAAKAKPGTSRRSSALDVYWDQKTGLSPVDGKLFMDQGLPQGAAARCASRVASGKQGFPSLDVFPGDQFCLRTSDGRVAWLRVGEGSDRPDELSVQVTVWDGVPG
ncbi:hypothetical protein [Kineosporia mesophila]|uniref:hypothetical protein n=1 Tax=Kineosporia mesophila TaxID=566012 RepID=UPI001E591641|nr:hypothetical protein [Kineosporia mesophila]MCD5349270.1 hypothetical protein [Kineosporia mesophila]